MLPPMIGTAERLEQAIFVVFVDVDRLKLANDSFGHEFGDHVLRAVSESLQEVVREGDLVCRWGGDEFTVVGLGSEPDSEEFAQRVHTQLLNTGIDLHKWVGGLSFGSAHAAARAMSIDALIQIADSRMYESRRARREPSRWQTDPER